MKDYELDFEKLKAGISITQVAETMLGLKLKPTKADELRGCCPISQGTNPRQFVITPSLGSFVCFCDDCKRFAKRGGDAIELVRRMRRLDKSLPAAKEIAQHFGFNCTAAAPTTRPETPASKGDFDAATFQKRLQPDHEALKGCHVSPETIREWGGGFCSGGSLAGRLALPICDLDGNIKAFLGVALNGEDPDIKYPKGFSPPFFFGVQKVQSGKDLHIFYHPLDVLRYAEDDYNAIAILTPTTRDVLTSLVALMDGRGITAFEFH